MSNAFQSGLNALMEPYSMMLLAGLAFLASSHAADPATSVVQKLAKKLELYPATQTIGKWLTTHVTQAVGLACYLATVLVEASRKQLGAWVAAAVGAAILIPESSAYQYAFQCVALTIYLRTQRKDTRTLIVIAVAALWMAGLLGGATETSKPAAASRASG